MKNCLLAIIIPLLAIGSLHAQNIAGDWQGILRANGAELRLVLHITKNDDGSFKATLDSIDQTANGIPITTMSLKDSNLNFTVAAVHGSYQGTVNADTINGTWTQLQPLPLTFQRVTTPIKPKPKPAKPSDIDGDWWGMLNTGLFELRMVFHITNTEDGLTATADSPDQGAKGMPVTTVTRNGSALKLEMKQLAGMFEGKLDPALTSIAGTWTQAGRIFPLVLTRLKNPAEIGRAHV